MIVFVDSILYSASLVNQKSAYYLLLVQYIYCTVYSSTRLSYHLLLILVDRSVERKVIVDITLGL